MRIGIALLAAAAAMPLAAQDPAVYGNIDEAFRLAGVRNMLESLPAHVSDMTTAAVAQYPREQRRQFEPVIKDVSAKFLDPENFYKKLRIYFYKHYDASHMNTFLALERTPTYRTMHRLEDISETPASAAARRRFENNLRADPPQPKRIDTLTRLDETRDATGLQMRMVVNILNAMSAALGAQMPPDLEAQSEAFTGKLRPILSNVVMHNYLFAYRNTDDGELDDIVQAEQQRDVIWFNRTLESAMVSVASEQSAKAGETIKAKLAQPFN